jgi:transcriptional regulator with XRE-family HTH domain
MNWDGEKIRDLRLRMGWSQSDLARRLHIDSKKISEMEMGLQETPDEVNQALELILKQAELTAEEVSCDSLAEIMFDEEDVLQVDNSSIRRKFLDQ